MLRSPWGYCRMTAQYQCDFTPFSPGRKLTECVCDIGDSKLYSISIALLYFRGGIVPHSVSSGNECDKSATKYVH